MLVQIARPHVQRSTAKPSSYQQHAVAFTHWMHILPAVPNSTNHVDSVNMARIKLGKQARALSYLRI